MAKVKSHSDPTYEAWKLSSEQFLSERESTPILPMRHGNKIKGVGEGRLGCHSDPTYEAWKLERGEQNEEEQDRTPILPMRHGNLSLRNYTQLTTKTPILPMRHGNQFLLHQACQTFHHSDPTYEAWKLFVIFQRNPRKTRLRSYL